MALQDEQRLVPTVGVQRSFCSTHGGQHPPCRLSAAHNHAAAVLCDAVRFN